MINVYAKNTGETLGFPDSMSQDEIKHVVDGEINGKIERYRPTFYEKVFRDPLEKIGVHVWQEPQFMAKAAGAGVLQTATFGAIKPTPEEADFYHKIAPVSYLAGEFGGFAIPGAGLDALTAKVGAAGLKFLAGAQGVESVGQFAFRKALAESIDKAAPTLAPLAAKAIPAAARTGAVMGEYTVIADSITQTQELQEGQREEYDFTAIGEEALKQAGMWSVAGGLTGVIAKPLAGMATKEAAAQFSREIAATAGSMYAISRASGADQKDSILAAGMAAVYHGVHVANRPESRKAAVEQIQNLHANYLRAKNPMLAESVAIRSAQEHTKEEAQKIIDETPEGKAQAVYEDINQQLLDNGYKPDQANANAQLWQAAALRGSKVQGITVEDWYAKNRPEIKSNSQEAPKPDALMQEIGNTVFFSKLENTVAEKMPNAATPEMIRGILSDKNGVRAEEYKWLGIDDFLAGKTKVSKDELLDHIRQNQVEIKEVEKGGARKHAIESIGWKQDVPGQWHAEVDGRRFGMNQESEGIYVYEDGGILGQVVNSFTDAKAKVIDALTKNPSTKFQNYQLPGGENYREMLLTLPIKKEEKDSWMSVDTSVPFRSSHFDEPNILAHVRMNDRVDADGKKVLFLEEVQSDWHQKGKKSGYSMSEEERAPLEKRRFEIEKIGQELGAEKTPNELKQEWVEIMNKLQPEAQANKVPNAPFKKTWHELALKRMLRYAAENGYDKLAWTTGEQQAERYDLSKQVDKISYVPFHGKYIVTAFKDGRGIPFEDGKAIDAAKLEDYVGKEIAKKIVDGDGTEVNYGANNEPQKIYKELSGVNLKVGGEGMKGFYDQILPSFMNKYAKKWGGRVSESKIKTDEKTEYVYEGPTYTLEQLKAAREITKGIGNVMTSPLTGKRMEFSATNVSADNPLRDLIKEMESGKTFEEAINAADRSFSGQFYDLLGGEQVAKSAIPNVEKMHSIEITPSMKKSVMEEGQPLFQRGEREPRGWVELAKDGKSVNKIVLSAGRDASTFIHESAHIWLNDLHNFTKYERSTEQFNQDWTTLKDWLGIKEGQKELSRAQHEKFARGFEAYLMEGKAPSSQLQASFDKFKDWLSEIYKSVRALRVNLSDDVRGVMDRMLAETENPINKVARSAELTQELARKMSGNILAAESDNPLIGKTNKSENRLSEWTDIIDAFPTREGKIAQIKNLDVSDTIKAKIMDYYGLLFEPLGKDIKDDRVFSDKEKEDVKLIYEILSLSEGPQIIKSDDGSYSRLSSGWPTFLSNRGYTAKELQNIFAKIAENKPLTEKQNKIAESVLKDYNDLKQNVGKEEKAIDEELSALRDRFPEITDKQIREIEAELEKEDLWSEERYQKAVEKYLAKKEGSEIAQGEIPQEVNPATQSESAKIPEFKTSQEALEFGEKNANNQKVIDDLNQLYQNSFNEQNPAKTALLKSALDAAKQFQADFPETKVSVYQNIINRLQSIEDTVTRAKSLGADIKPGEDAGKSADRYLSTANQAQSVLERGTYRITPEGKVEVTGEGLKPILDEFDATLKEAGIAEKDRELDLNDYLLSKRIVEDLQRKATPESEKNIASEAQVEKAKEILDELNDRYGDKIAVFEDTAQRIYDYQKRVLQSLVDQGLVTQKSFDTILDQNPNYVPFDRVLPQEDSSVLPVSRGRFSKVKSPVKKIKGSELPIYDPIESIIKNTYKILDAAGRNKVFKDIYGLKDIEGLGIVEVSGKKEGGLNKKDNIIQGSIAGEKKYLKVTESLYDSMTGLNEQSSSILIKILASPANWLRTGATLTPEFIARNPIRDQWTALLQTQFGFRPFVDPAQAMGDILNKSEIYHDWIRSGGSYAGFVELSRPNLANMVKNLRGKKNILAQLNIITQLSELSQFMEQSTRIGVYRAALRSGMSPVEAAREAREGTINFNRRGSQMKEINSLLTFFNAGIQSSDKTIRVLAKDPLGLATKGLATITIPSLMFYMLNRDDQEYKELPRWQKDLFWMFKAGDTWVRIPKPFLYGQVFGSMPERFMEYVDTKDPAAFDKFKDSLYGSMSPIAGDPASGLLATAVKPIIENQANWSFFRNRAIVSDVNKDLIPSEQYSKYDTETSKALGKLFNVSPSKIENLSQGWFGGSGRYALQIGDLAIRQIAQLQGQPVENKKPAELADIPLVRGFVARSPQGFNSESVSNFYQERSEITKLKNTYDKYKKMDDQDKADKFLEKNPLINISKQLDAKAKSISSLSKEIDRIVASDVEETEKRATIRDLEAQITEIAVEANKLIKEAKVNK